MPLIIKDKSYLLPSEGSEKAPTGKEIVEIETYFNLDGLILLTALSQDKPPVGYTKTKGMYALAWIALTRAGEVVSIDDVLKDYGLDEFDFVEEEAAKKPKAVN